ADFDGDGHDDIYFCNQLGPNALYRNQGDGTFADVAAAAGVALGDRVCVGATFFDFDNDGKPDLFVASTRGGNVLFRNLGGGKFTDVTAPAGLAGRGGAGDAVAADYDGDGRTDLFVTSMFGRCQLYRNNGDGTFTDVTLKVLGRTPFGALGARVFDFNNDGR